MLEALEWGDRGDFKIFVDTHEHTRKKRARHNVLETAKRNLLPNADLRYVLLSATWNIRSPFLSYDHGEITTAATRRKLQSTRPSFMADRRHLVTSASSSSSSSSSSPKLLQRVAPLSIVLFTAPKFVNPSPIRLSCVKSAGRHLKVKSGTRIVVKITRYSERFLVFYESDATQGYVIKTIYMHNKTFRMKGPIEKFDKSHFVNF